MEGWHETLGTATVVIAVAEGRTATISFTFAAR